MYSALQLFISSYYRQIIHTVLKHNERTRIFQMNYIIINIQTDSHNLESKFLYACLNKRLFTQFVKSHKIMIRYMEKNTYIQEDQVCLTKETLVFYYESMKS